MERSECLENQLQCRLPVGSMTFRTHGWLPESVPSAVEDDIKFHLTALVNRARCTVVPFAVIDCQCAYGGLFSEVGIHALRKLEPLERKLRLLVYTEFALQCRYTSRGKHSLRDLHCKLQQHVKRLEYSLLCTPCCKKNASYLDEGLDDESSPIRDDCCQSGT